MTGAAPKVSVCVITYNHGPYIADCLHSIVEQQGQFAFEVIVGDDCSTDGTSRIVDDIAGEHPGLIKVLRPAENRGGTENFLTTHEAASGDYIAHLDGDDLALGGKLAAQAAFLDQHPDVVACGHRVAVIAADGSPTGATFPAAFEEVFDVRKVITCGMPFVNSSLMYRRKARTLKPGGESEIFDWYFLTDLMRSGPAGYIPTELGLYRVNPRSTTATLSRGRMRERMLEQYARRAKDEPQYKAEYFASAFFDLLACAKDGEPVTSAHRDLLRETFRPRGLFLALETAAWRWRNRRALAR